MEDVDDHDVSDDTDASDNDDRIFCTPHEGVILLCGDKVECNAFYEQELMGSLVRRKIALACADYENMIWLDRKNADRFESFGPESIAEIDRQRREDDGIDCWVRHIASRDNYGVFPGVVVMIGTPIQDIPYYYSCFRYVYVVDVRKGENSRATTVFDIEQGGNSRATLSGKPVDLIFHECLVVEGTDKIVAEALAQSVLETVFKHPVK